MNKSWFIKVAIGLLVALATAGCEGQNSVPAQRVDGGDASRGRGALVGYGCETCHEIPGVSGADATVGPPLTRFAQRGFIAGELSNEPDNLIQWIMNPQSVEPGTAMPDLGVTESAARDIAAYLYTLK